MRSSLAVVVFQISRLAFCGLCCTGTLGAGQPNIIFIMTDDAGYNEFGYNNALSRADDPTVPLTYASTPNIDALAAQSVVARQAYAMPLCSPTRVSFLTGQYNARQEVQDVLPNNINIPYGMDAGTPTLPSYLKDLGYSTGIIGKWHLGFTEGVNRPLDLGFDEFFGFLGGSRNYFGESAPSNVMWRNNTNVEATWDSAGPGRYITDAFNEEAVSFINNHAQDENPFFLYVAQPAPHTPYQAKAEDYALFSHITDLEDRTIAAMLYAVDRGVGQIVDALTANGLDENTILVFTNDNGGTVSNDNRPLRLLKGLTFEGGIRVPFLIRAPGLEPGQYDRPVSVVDMLPSFLAAAGGDPSGLATDGVDVMPYLTGQATGDPHESLIWKDKDKWAIRKGDWKLGRLAGDIPGFTTYLFNLATDLKEVDNRLAAEPLIAAELYREFTEFETQVPKPTPGGIFDVENFHPFDHFAFKGEGSTTTNWSTVSAWFRGGSADVTSLYREDADPNLALEFSTKNDASYTANNDMTRITGLTFMLNEMRFTGNFTGGANQTGAVGGNALLLVRNLSGEAPRIRFDAMSSGTNAKFAFALNNELQLYHDLEITGDGTQNFVINGRIRDYYEPLEPNVTTPHNVTKTGTSQVTLTANSTFRGTLTVSGGMVRISGVNAAIDGAAGISIGDGGTVALDSGLIAVTTLDNSTGGTFNFTGGTLRVVDVIGNLTNNGGTFAPGASPAESSISGNFTNASGVLQIELAATARDRLSVRGSATLGGVLDIDLLDGLVPSIGQAFEILAAAGGVNGVFSNIDAPTLTGKSWNLLYGAKSVILAIGGPGGTTIIPGDYNHDGMVDAADYVTWRISKSTGNLVADGNGSGDIDIGDFNVWRSNFGLSLIGGSGSANPANVPEPTAAGLLFVGAVIASTGRCRGCCAKA